MKNLKKLQAKQLTRKELQTIKGAETYYISCSNGINGQAHNVDSFDELVAAGKQICGSGTFTIS
ncbi:hypothetical protein [Chryseobacterium populi]|uniref:Uncharacterized protein n=1 Tax=Chryseobacterium populi TaxID=1144316 RepID=J2SUN2_9FLAO|nr:hypothetical protein [Chryseobacterium populi]EJL69322.1 hypothetical protein PMI13_03289 [Chryseobacterium populi]